MRIGIVGAGRIAEIVARRSVAAGDEVIVATRRRPADLAEAVAGWGAQAVEIADVAEADVSVLAVPWPAVPDVAAAASWTGSILWDTTNALLPPRFEPAELGSRTSTEVVAELFPAAQVVKAYNAWDASVLEQPPRRPGGRMVQYVSGDDGTARRTVADILTRWGYASLDLGEMALGSRLMNAPDGPLVRRILLDGSD